MMFCVAMWIWMSPLTYWNLNSSSKVLVLQWLFEFMLVYCKNGMIYLIKKVCLIIIHGNKTHILVMSCYHKHQQERYHHENTEICMIIHYMYVDILYPLTKTIRIMFECVTTHYQTLQTWTGHNTMRYHNANALPHELPHSLPYIFSQFTMGRQ